MQPDMGPYIALAWAASGLTLGGYTLFAWLRFRQRQR
jgi:hypothetical protein